MTFILILGWDMTEKNNLDMNIKNIKEECDICGEYFNKRDKKKITCPFEACKKSCCSLCFKRFLLDCGITPICMWCKKDLSSDFIQDNTTQKFFGEYTEHCTGILVERDESNLHQIQHLANEELKKRQLEQLLSKLTPSFMEIEIDSLKNRSEMHAYFIDILERKSSPFTKKYRLIPSNWRFYLDDNDRCSICREYTYPNDIVIDCSKCNTKMCITCSKCVIAGNRGSCIVCKNNLEINYGLLPVSFYNKFLKPKKKRKDISEIFELFVCCAQKQIKLTEKLIGLCMQLYNIEGERVQPENKEEKRIMNFVKKCPDNNCRGFLSSSWKCGICEEYYCSDCHKKKNGRNDEEHVCDENEKATVSLLKTDSKPCPNCGMPINRISGCSQVWTPCCKIAFDWNTGKIDKGRIHSPEYYDFMRRTEGFVPREVGDNPCGGDFDFYSLNRLFRHNPIIYRVNIMKEHVNNVSIPKLPADLSRVDNSDLGLKYLVGDIDKNEWKKILKARTKKNQKNNNIYNILNMYTAVVNDLFRNLQDSKDVDQFTDQTEKIRIYCNEQIEKINKRFKSNEKQFFLNYHDGL